MLSRAAPDAPMPTWHERLRGGPKRRTASGGVQLPTRPDYSESNVAKMIRDARDRGFLAGNELTARARQILGNVPRRSR